MIVLSAMKKKIDEKSIASFLESSAKDKAAVFAQFKEIQKNKSSVSQCSETLMKLLILLSNGEKLAPVEADNIFFAITNLIEINDQYLRKLIHIAVYEICDKVSSAYIMEESLKRDCNINREFVKTTAIKTLCKIIDSSKLASIERLMMQLIVNQNGLVSSAALVSVMKFVPTNSELIQRWINEIKDAMESPFPAVQYHAMVLFYKLKRKDNLALSKILSQMDGTFRGRRSSHTYCTSVRISAQVIMSSSNQEVISKHISFLENRFHSKDDAVVLEICRLVACYPDKLGHLLKRAIQSINLFLGSSNSSSKFFALKILSQFASSHKKELLTCIPLLQQMIKDKNRALSIISVSILLKIGSENSISNVLNELTKLLVDLPTSFILFVVKQLHELTYQFPKRCKEIIDFLLFVHQNYSNDKQINILVTREIVSMLKYYPQLLEYGMEKLCELIEDCMIHDVTIDILSFLGDQGMHTTRPTFFIRYVYNRILLDIDEIRSAAVTTLAKFGAACSFLKKSVLILLSRLMNDRHSDVRDRACYYFQILSNNEEEFIQNSLKTNTIFDVDDTLSHLQSYIEKGNFSSPVSFGNVQRKTLDQILSASQQKSEVSSQPAATASESSSNVFDSGDHGTTQDTAVSILQQVNFDPIADAKAALDKLNNLPDDIGQLINTTVAIDLTEPQYEYHVTCVKYIYVNHAIFQLTITNNQIDKVLKNVKCKVKVPKDFVCLSTSSCSVISNNHGYGYIHIIIGLPQLPIFDCNEFPCFISFSVVDCNPDSGEIFGSEEREEHQIDTIIVKPCDNFSPLQVDNFRELWDLIGEENESEMKFSLSPDINNILSGVKFIISQFGGILTNGSSLPKASATTHTIYLASRYKTGDDTLVCCMFALTDRKTIITKVSLRCADPNVSEILFSSLQ